MEIIVQKFGGTSVGRSERMLDVAKIVKSTLDQDKQVVVVLSAMSSGVKAEGTTSNLLKAADEAIKKGSYYKILDILEDYHLGVVNETVGDEAIREDIAVQVRAELHKLKSFLDAIQVIGEISPRSMDAIIGTGEKLSAIIFASILNSKGIDAEAVILDDIIDQPFREVSQEFCRFIQEKLKARLLKSNKVPVVTGYFGFVPGGILKNIGRGYTDFTAALCAAATNAQELQIWKEVDGIFSADPRKVESAKVLASISPEEAMELTYYGSEVIHPFTMEQVTNANVPLRIKNTFAPELPGTIIDPKGVKVKTKGATAVTAKKDVTVINIHSNRMMMAYGFMSKVFEVFEKYEMVIDLVSTSEVNVSLTLDDNTNLERALGDLKKLGKVEVRENMAILSLVGQGMQHAIGMSGKMFNALAQENINIEVISQGASEINISCVIDGQHAEKAIKAVHEIIHAC